MQKKTKRKTRVKIKDVTTLGELANPIGKVPKVSPPTKEIRYSFPTVSRCPRCGSTNTRAYSTKKQVQYRVCLAPICRHKYSVYGQKA